MIFDATAAAEVDPDLVLEEVTSPPSVFERQARELHEPAEAKVPPPPAAPASPAPFEPWGGEAPEESPSQLAGPDRETPPPEVAPPPPSAPAQPPAPPPSPRQQAIRDTIHRLEGWLSAIEKR
jgi:hypothetical protein